MALEHHLEHREHCERMNAEGPCDGVGDGNLDGPLSSPGKEGCIRAVPVITVVDGYTAAAVDLSIQQQQAISSKRYTILASIKIVESSNDAKEPSAIKLMGVGRVFLRNYFLLKTRA